MKDGKIRRSLLLLLALCLAVSPVMALAEAAETEEEAALPVFAWKTYEMTIPYATTDLEAYGMKDFQGTHVVIRVCAVEGKIVDADFEQKHFVLRDADGNERECRFYACPNTERMITGAFIPSAEQDYYDLFFNLEELTEETLGEMFLAVYEDPEGEPVLVPLLGVPNVLPEE